MTEKIGQLDVLEETVDNGGGLEGGSRLLNSSNHIDERAKSSEQRVKYEDGGRTRESDRDQFLISRVIWLYLLPRGRRGVVTCLRATACGGDQSRPVAAPLPPSGSAHRPTAPGPLN